MFKAVNIHDYKVTDCGRWGKAGERTCTGKQYVKSAGKVDWYHLGQKFEIKTGAGELDEIIKKKTCKKVLFIPVVLEDDHGYIRPEYQEGFILTREDFLKVLDEVGLIREKTSTAGYRKTTIQTFWNHKQNKPHGSKLYKLLDLLYETCEETLEDHIARLQA